MEIKLLHKYYDREHLETVKKEMEQRGTPTIKAVWVDHADYYQSLEGSHRIRAAKELGITPEIEAVDYDEYRDKDITEIDWMDLDNDDCTIDKLIDDCLRDSISIDFD